jgi:UDP-2,3-diacylglucosamine hydrolase
MRSVPICSSTKADAVFVLGDLFEVWVGDDMRHRPFESACVDVLAEAASQRCLAFLVGNRDFLVGSEMLRASGMTGLPDPTVLNAWGQRLLLSHGDALCLADLPYQAFRNKCAHAAWQPASWPSRWRSGCRSPPRSARQRTRRRSTATADADVDTGAGCALAATWAQPNWCTATRTGPGTRAWGPAFKRHVLSDWDLDHAQRAEVLRLTRDGLQRLAPSAA